MRIQIIVLCIFLHCIAINPLSSQDYLIKKFTIEDGRKSNPASGFIQDSNGFLWIVSGSTQIFDGIVFRNIDMHEGFWGVNAGSTVIANKKLYHLGPNGYYEIDKFQPTYWPIPDDLARVFNPEGSYSNNNPKVLSRDGTVYLIKKKPTGGDQIATHNDTVYKISKTKITKLHFPELSADTNMYLRLTVDQYHNNYIILYNLKTRYCKAAYILANDVLNRIEFIPDGHIYEIIKHPSGYYFNYYDSLYHQKIATYDATTKTHLIYNIPDCSLNLGKCDHAGNYWIANLKGLVKVSAITGDMETFRDPESRPMKEVNVSRPFKGKHFETDWNYKDIDFTSNNEVVTGLKIFSKEKGFKKVIDSTLVPPNALQALYVDNQDNIWFGADYLFRAVKTSVRSYNGPATYTLHLVSPGNHRIYYRESKAGIFLLSISENGITTDSLFVPMHKLDSRKIYTLKHSSAIVLCEKSETKMRLIFHRDGRFVNHEKLTSLPSSTYGSIIIKAADSLLLIRYNNKQIIFSENISMDIQNVQIDTLWPSETFWWDYFPIKDFPGYISPKGVLIYVNGKWSVNKTINTRTLKNEYTKIIAHPEYLGRLILFPLKKQKAFLLDESRCEEIKLAGAVDDFYPESSTWINDTAYLAVSLKGTTLIRFNRHFTIANLMDLNPTSSYFCDASQIRKMGGLIFLHPSDQNIRYISKDSLFETNPHFNEIKNSFQSIFNSQHQFDETSKRLHILGDDKFINVSDLEVPKPEPLLAFLYYSFSRNDSVVTHDPVDDAGNLSYSSFPLAFRYQAVSLDGSKIGYMYKLAGLDDTWALTDDNELRYPTLPPGTYTLCVRAVNDHNIWSKTPVKMSFTVTTPWYRTWIFYAVIVLGIVQLQTFRLRRQKWRLEKAVKERTIEISQQKHLIETKQREIFDSINYAYKIQRAMLASEESLKSYFPGHFILYKPKDVVSGDFYWCAELKNGSIAFVVADSTGHGVPGAIMSMLNISCLHEATESQGIVEPHEILNHTRNSVIKHLSGGGNEGGRDGMDCSVMIFTKDLKELRFAAANNPVWIVRAGELIELEPDRMPVGRHDRQKESFNRLLVNLLPGDHIYAFTDGIPDQFGGPKGKKFMYRRLKEIILANSTKPLSEQHALLENEIASWQGEHEQVDDITLIAIKVS